MNVFCINIKEVSYHCNELIQHAPKVPACALFRDAAFRTLAKSVFAFNTAACMEATGDL